jgi:hypothetical protein
MDRIDAARKVLDYSRELALAVRAVTLDEALETVKVARIGPRKRSSPLSGHFIGRKARKKLSANPNPVTIDAARENLMAKVAALRKSDDHTRRSSLHSDTNQRRSRREIFALAVQAPRSAAVNRLVRHCRGARRACILAREARRGY